MESLDGKKCVSVSAEGSRRRFITRSPLKSPLHHRVREEERTAVSEANRAEERAAERRKTEPENTGGEGGGGGRRTQVWWREIQKVRAGACCLSGYPPSPRPCFFHLCAFLRGPWAPPPWRLLPFPGPPLSTCPGLPLSSAELEPHAAVVRQCRLNVTVELLTFGPEMAGRSQLLPWQHPFTRGYFGLALMYPA